MIRRIVAAFEQAGLDPYLNATFSDGPAGIVTTSAVERALKKYPHLMLFSGPYPDNPGWTRPRSYDVTPDGERFLMTRLAGEPSRPRVVVVLNWFEELRAKVPR